MNRNNKFFFKNLISYSIISNYYFFRLVNCASKSAVTLFYRLLQAHADDYNILEYWNAFYYTRTSWNARYYRQKYSCVQEVRTEKLYEPRTFACIFSPSHPKTPLYYHLLSIGG